MEGLILAWTGLLGACVGSFINVVAWRLPRQESVVFPGSHCLKCGHAIRWHDNLPVLGWLLLRRRCRDTRPVRRQSLRCRQASSPHSAVIKAV